ncbi:MAG: hypothetical protein GY758_20010 [Fuerstiella sp.]|nr:hypothetical protein [Fuerstiella sp.]MCP4507266.1 hypothetical protein [Fuerstiella sp.]
MSHTAELRQQEWRSAASARRSPAPLSMRTGAAGRSSGNRRGSLMVEMVVAAVMLSTVAAILVPGIYAVHQQRQATRFDTLSLIELNNLSAVSRNMGVADRNTLKLSEWFTERYDDAKLEVQEVTADTVEPPLQAFKFTIIRPAGDDRPDFRHSLVAWVATQGVPE